MQHQQNFSALDWWALQTDGIAEVYLVKRSDYDSLEPKGIGSRRVSVDTIFTLSFESFLKQWIQKKWQPSRVKPLFSVYIDSSTDRSKYQFSILASGHDDKRNLCLLAICCASYFTDKYPHKPNRNKAYIEKTESVGLRDPIFKKYHFNEVVSLTIAMKTAFVEYMGVLGCEVHLWAYPAEVNADDNLIYDLLLPGSSKNRSEKVQQRTQTDLLQVYVNGYEYFGITPRHFQLDIVLPKMADIPVFLNNDDGYDELDVKQAEFDEAVGSDIKKFKKELEKSLAEIKEQSNAINKRLKESTLILGSQYYISSSKENENSYIPIIKIPDYNYPKLDENILQEKLKTLYFYPLDKVVESTQKLFAFLNDELKVENLDFNDIRSI